MASSRVSRGRRTQVLVAEFFESAGVFPNAESIAASLPGKDILNTPGYAIEVKARRDFNPVEWSKQAAKNAGDEIPVVVMRPDGLGEENVDKFLAFMTLDQFTSLIGRIQHLDHISTEYAKEIRDLQRNLNDAHDELERYESGHHN